MKVIYQVVDPEDGISETIHATCADFGTARATLARLRKLVHAPERLYIQPVGCLELGEDWDHYKATSRFLASQRLCQAGID